ncbi:hypothetical protein HDU97_006712 [Phlyctochytrium planicorne]|nr:hypothetical protein HDU97_006712 [Phlyctochytrium planicorne]
MERDTENGMDASASSQPSSPTASTTSNSSLPTPTTLLAATSTTPLSSPLPQSASSASAPASALSSPHSSSALANWFMTARAAPSAPSSNGVLSAPLEHSSAPSPESSSASSPAHSQDQPPQQQHDPSSSAAEKIRSLLSMRSPHSRSNSMQSASSTLGALGAAPSSSSTLTITTTTQLPAPLIIASGADPNDGSGVSIAGLQSGQDPGLAVSHQQPTEPTTPQTPARSRPSLASVVTSTTTISTTASSSHLPSPTSLTPSTPHGIYKPQSVSSLEQPTRSRKSSLIHQHPREGLMVNNDRASMPASASPQQMGSEPPSPPNSLGTPNASDDDASSISSASSTSSIPTAWSRSNSFSFHRATPTPAQAHMLLDRRPSSPFVPTPVSALVDRRPSSPFVMHGGSGSQSTLVSSGSGSSSSSTGGPWGPGKIGSTGPQKPPAMPLKQAMSTTATTPMKKATTFNAKPTIAEDTLQEGSKDSGKQADQGVRTRTVALPAPISTSKRTLVNQPNVDTVPTTSTDSGSSHPANRFLNTLKTLVKRPADEEKAKGLGLGMMRSASMREGLIGRRAGKGSKSEKAERPVSAIQQPTTLSPLIVSTQSTTTPVLSLTGMVSSPVTPSPSIINADKLDALSPPAQDHPLFDVRRAPPKETLGARLLGTLRSPTPTPTTPHPSPLSPPPHISAQTPTSATPKSMDQLPYTPPRPTSPVQEEARGVRLKRSVSWNLGGRIGERKLEDVRGSFDIRRGEREREMMMPISLATFEREGLTSTPMRKITPGTVERPISPSTITTSTSSEEEEEEEEEDEIEFHRGAFSMDIPRATSPMGSSPLARQIPFGRLRSALGRAITPEDQNARDAMTTSTPTPPDHERREDEDVMYRGAFSMDIPRSTTPTTPTSKTRKAMMERLRLALGRATPDPWERRDGMSSPEPTDQHAEMDRLRLGLSPEPMPASKPMTRVRAESTGIMGLLMKRSGSSLGIRVDEEERRLSRVKSVEDEMKKDGEKGVGGWIRSKFPKRVLGSTAERGSVSSSSTQSTAVAAVAAREIPPPLPEKEIHSIPMAQQHSKPAYPLSPPPAVIPVIQPLPTVSDYFLLVEQSERNESPLPMIPFDEEAMRREVEEGWRTWSLRRKGTWGTKPAAGDSLVRTLKSLDGSGDNSGMDESIPSFTESSVQSSKSEASTKSTSEAEAPLRSSLQSSYISSSSDVKDLEVVAAELSSSSNSSVSTPRPVPSRPLSMSLISSNRDDLPSTYETETSENLTIESSRPNSPSFYSSIAPTHDTRSSVHNESTPRPPTPSITPSQETRDSASLSSSEFKGPTPRPASPSLSLHSSEAPSEIIMPLGPVSPPSSNGRLHSLTLPVLNSGHEVHRRETIIVPSSPLAEDLASVRGEVVATMPRDLAPVAAPRRSFNPLLPILRSEHKTKDEVTGKNLLLRSDGTGNGWMTVGKVWRMKGRSNVGSLGRVKIRVVDVDDANAYKLPSPLKSPPLHEILMDGMGMEEGGKSNVKKEQEPEQDYFSFKPLPPSPKSPEAGPTASSVTSPSAAQEQHPRWAAAGSWFKKIKLPRPSISSPTPPDASGSHLKKEFLNLPEGAISPSPSMVTVRALDSPSTGSSLSSQGKATAARSAGLLGQRKGMWGFRVRMHEPPLVPGIKKEQQENPGRVSVSLPRALNVVEERKPLFSMDQLMTVKPDRNVTPQPQQQPSAQPAAQPAKPEPQAAPVVRPQSPEIIQPQQYHHLLEMTSSSANSSRSSTPLGKRYPHLNLSVPAPSLSSSTTSSHKMSSSSSSSLNSGQDDRFGLSIKPYTPGRSSPRHVEGVRGKQEGKGVSVTISYLAALESARKASVEFPGATAIQPKDDIISKPLNDESFPSKQSARSLGLYSKRTSTAASSALAETSSIQARDAPESEDEEETADLAVLEAAWSEMRPFSSANPLGKDAVVEDAVSLSRYFNEMQQGGSEWDGSLPRPRGKDGAVEESGSLSRYFTDMHHGGDMWDSVSTRSGRSRVSGKRGSYARRDNSSVVMKRSKSRLRGRMRREDSTMRTRRRSGVTLDTSSVVYAEDQDRSESVEPWEVHGHSSLDRNSERPSVGNAFSLVLRTYEEGVCQHCGIPLSQIQNDNRSPSPPPSSFVSGQRHHNHLPLQVQTQFNHDEESVSIASSPTTSSFCCCCMQGNEGGEDSSSILERGRSRSLQRRPTQASLFQFHTRMHPSPLQPGGGFHHHHHHHHHHHAHGSAITPLSARSPFPFEMGNRGEEDDGQRSGNVSPVAALQRVLGGDDKNVVGSA